MEQYKTEEYRGRKINIYYDQDAESPRSWDNVATFVCEYRGYTLGDKQDVDSEIERLFNDHVSSKAIIDYFIKSRHAEFVDGEDGDDCDHYYKYQTKWYDGKLHDEYISADSTDDDEDGIAEEMAEKLGNGEKLLLIEESGEVAILPISLYDHSGITIWLGSINGHVDSQWDCSRVGFAYIEKSTVENEGMLDPGEVFGHDWKKWAYDRMETEMHIYDQYLRGDAYGYMIEDEDGCEGGGCWGFFGSDFDKNGLMESAKNEIDYDIQAEEKKRKENIETVQNGLLTLSFGHRIFISGRDVFRVVREPMFGFLVLQQAKMTGNHFGENDFNDVNLSTIDDYALNVLAGFIKKVNNLTRHAV